MEEIQVEHPQDPTLAIAAVMFLLSGASLRGASPAGCNALLQHLERLSCSPDVPATLRDACAELHSMWIEATRALRHDCPLHCRQDDVRCIH